MTAAKFKAVCKHILFYFYSFILVFSAVSFITTCSLLLSFNSIDLTESTVREFAPIVFVNVIVLSVVMMLIDSIRRKLTVDRAAKEIQHCLQQLMDGNFDVRVDVSHIAGKYNQFGKIAASINRLAEELSGVETLRTDFIANVSHELKTPLAVVQNYATMLKQPGLSEEKRLEYAHAVTNTSLKLSQLITNILKLNKLENQQIFPSAADYNLGEQLCECLLQYENEWERKNIDISTDITEDVIIHADAELLSLVWNNLFSNAFKFTEDGGLVSVSLTADDAYATVKVSDTGCGMTSEVGAHIFEKFYQGDTSHATQGNGLGLALVKRVVDIMQGEIAVDSVRGKGSTFTIKIPRSYGR